VPPEIRGVINLRGKVMQLIDLRVKLGLPSAKAEFDELIQLLHDREQDHHNWLTELEACVRERRPFKMAKDPHACKFGLWYDKYQTDNSLLKMTLKKMDEPHQIIHATAEEVLQMVERGDLDGAMKLLAARRNGELAELSKLFEEARRILREHQRELSVVLNRGEKRFAISIDLVEAVERIPEEGIEPLPAALAGQSEKLQWRIGKRAKTSQTVLLLDEDFLFASEAAIPENIQQASTN
jgi:purine-binding chemotaxis protein CheW